MTIQEMHQWFRLYAQQMGMQNVRTILPEEIDTFINTSISDIVDQIIKENITTSVNKNNGDNAKINQINALSTLYKTEKIDAETPTTTFPTGEVLLGISYDSQSPIGKFYIKNISNLKTLYISNLALRYKNLKDIETVYYPIRLVDEEYFSNSVTDYMLQPKLQSPIAIFADDELDIYLGKEYDVFKDELYLKDIKISYIKQPVKVCINDGTDCDLPESKHMAIMKHSLDMYRIAYSGMLNSPAQQLQQQQYPQQYQQQE